MNNEARDNVARWPVKWRLRWGQRTNELERLGMPWRKAELEAYRQVASERAVIGDFATVEEFEPHADPDKRVPDTRGPQRWRCERPLCNGGGWWLSKSKALNCLSCCPPSWPDQIVKRGTVDDAPLVEPDRSTTPLGTRYEREHVEPTKRPARRKATAGKR